MVCSELLCIQFKSIASWLKASTLVASESHFLQIMGFCWLNQMVASSCHWSGSQPNVKLWEWKLVPPNLGEHGPQPEWAQVIGPSGRVHTYIMVLFMREARDWQIGRLKKCRTYSKTVILCPSLTYGHELWVLTKKMRLRIKASRNKFSP